jgi:polyphosphate kinase
MHRNFDRRVEVTTPVRDPEISAYVRDTMLPAYLNDEVNAHVLNSDGTYAKVAPRSSGGFDSQMFFVGKETAA